MSSPSPCRFVYFDVASTLLEKAGLYETLVDVFADAGVDVPLGMLRERHRVLTEVVRFPDRTTRAFYADFNADLCLSVGVLPTPALVDRMYERCRGLPWRAFDDVDALRGLAATGLPLGILSNWDTSLEGHLLAQLGDGVSFARVIGSQLAGVAKPDPRIFELALRDLGVAPSEVTFVGDSLRLDIAPARALGIDAVLLDRHGHFPAYRGATITSLRDLLPGGRRALR